MLKKIKSNLHHYLISVGKRVQTALIVESGEIREVMHAALLLGYGASALCPYMTFAILDDLVKKHKIQEDYATAEKNYVKAVKKGLASTVKFLMFISPVYPQCTQGMR